MSANNKYDTVQAPNGLTIDVGGGDFVPLLAIIVDKDQSNLGAVKCLTSNGIAPDGAEIASNVGGESQVAAAASASAAATSEANALSYRNAAQTAQTGAEAAQTGAESARDAAFGNANVYADTAAGLAAVGEGGQFMVVVGDEIVRYQDTAGVAVEVARYPTVAAVGKAPSRSLGSIEDASVAGGGAIRWVTDGDIGFTSCLSVSDGVQWKRISLGASLIDIFVDSINGNDANDGLSPATAKQTIGAVTLVNNLRVGLMRGSYWREQFGSLANTATNVHVVAYGTGPLPIFDAADVASPGGWTPHATLPNVYQRTWAHDNIVSSFISLWEDTIRLRWVSSEANCSSTPGSFYAAQTAGASTVVYYHPTGSSAPVVNGKLVEISKRSHGLHSGSGRWIVEDIHTRRQLHNDGSLVMGGIARRCLVEDGTKHNMLLGVDSLAEDCIAWKCDWADRSNLVAFVAYTGNGIGYNATFRRCVSVMELDKVNAAVLAAKAIDGFYAHTGGDAQRWDAITFEDCSVYGATVPFAAGNVNVLSIVRPFASEFRTYLNSGALVQTNVIDPYLKGHGATIFPNRGITKSTSAPMVIEGARASWAVGTSGGIVYGNGITLKKSVLYRIAGQAGYVNFISGNEAVSENNIIFGPSTGNAESGLSSDATAIADNNVYWNTGIDFQISSVNYSTFSLYRAANPALDVNSVQADPLLNNPEGGDFGVQAGSPAIALGAGLERPNVTYTPIPSDEALTAM